MKNGPCPKCASRARYAIEKVLLEDVDSSNLVYPFSLTAHYGPTGESGLFGPKGRRAGVHAEAYVCVACGYSEIYAVDLDVLADFAADGRGGVRKIEG